MPGDPHNGARVVPRLLAARWPRALLDLTWCLAFVALFVAMLLRSPSGLSENSSVRLALVEGGQRQGLYRKGHRIGAVVWRVDRLERGWRVSHRFVLKGHPAARTVLQLRRDLSLSRLQLEADLSALSRISGGLSGMLLTGLGGIKRIDVEGDCSLESGDCHLKGQVGSHRIDHYVSAGRGPVVTSAIYPLLAQGSLGKTAEVRVFDPLSLGQRVVTFEVEGRERLRLRSGTYDAIRVVRDLEGLQTRVWIDPRGRVLKEQLPLGLVVEHEAWEGETDARRGKDD